MIFLRTFGHERLPTVPSKMIEVQQGFHWTSAEGKQDRSVHLTSTSSQGDLEPCIRMNWCHFSHRFQVWRSDRCLCRVSWLKETQSYEWLALTPVQFSTLHCGHPRSFEINQILKGVLRAGMLFHCRQDKIEFTSALRTIPGLFSAWLKRNSRRGTFCICWLGIRTHRLRRTNWRFKRLLPSSSASCQLMWECLLAQVFLDCRKPICDRTQFADLIGSFCCKNVTRVTFGRVCVLALEQTKWPGETKLHGCGFCALRFFRVQIDHSDF